MKKPFKKRSEDRGKRSEDRSQRSDRKSRDGRPGKKEFERREEDDSFRGKEVNKSEFKKIDLNEDTFRGKRNKRSDDRGHKRGGNERGKREGGRGREEGRGKRKEGRGKAEYGKRSDGDRKPFFKRRDDDRKPFKRRDDDRKPFSKREDGDRKPFFKRRDDDRKPFKKRDDDRKPFNKREDGDRKPFFKRRDDDRKPFKRRDDDRKPFKKKEDYKRDDRGGKRGPESSGGVRKERRTEFAKPNIEAANEGLTRLNKFIANAGICSRREADDLIKAGAVTVNGVVITEMGFKVKPEDEVHYGGQLLRREKMVYILLNKPKDYITTTDDPQGRDHVMQLIRHATRERVYPVGRLDRNTTGVLLFTNDGDLAKKLTHPKYNIAKVYHVVLDKSLTKFDFDQIINGVELEDGMANADALDYVGDGTNKREVGLEIHSGRNRVVRRMFEHLGYKVIKLDRVSFAGLTKKDTPRGKWRFLNEKEVGFLKMLSAGMN